MQNKDKGDGIEDFPLDMLLVILLEGASKEVNHAFMILPFLERIRPQILKPYIKRRKAQTLNELLML